MRISEKRKNEARVLLRKAVKAKKVKRKPCVICGAFCDPWDKVNRVMAHHEDYRQPLNVVWLCYRHHNWLHSDVNKIFKELNII
jgi:hypothetical protein